jgi:hypothetical protein
VVSVPGTDTTTNKSPGTDPGTDTTLVVPAGTDTGTTWKVVVPVSWYQCGTGTGAKLYNTFYMLNNKKLIILMIFEFYE